MSGHVLVIDQGTTSTRSMIFGPDAALVSMAQEEFPQIFPQPGWVEHDPEIALANHALDSASGSLEGGPRAERARRAWDNQPARNDIGLESDDWPSDS